jgi:hypothetical protein
MPGENRNNINTHKPDYHSELLLELSQKSCTCARIATLSNLPFRLHRATCIFQKDECRKPHREISHKATRTTMPRTKIEMLKHTKTSYVIHKIISISGRTIINKYAKINNVLKKS